MIRLDRGSFAITRIAPHGIVPIVGEPSRVAWGIGRLPVGWGVSEMPSEVGCSTLARCIAYVVAIPFASKVDCRRAILIDLLFHAIADTLFARTTLTAPTHPTEVENGQVLGNGGCSVGSERSAS